MLSTIIHQRNVEPPSPIIIVLLGIGVLLKNITMKMIFTNQINGAIYTVMNPDAGIKNPVQDGPFMYC